MAADFALKCHDVYPSIQAALTQKVGGVDTPLDLTGATGVKFILKADLGGAITVNAVATVVAPATAGKVRYDWIAADTAVVGTYKGEWEITWPGPKKQTVPTLSYHTVEILADLDNA